VYHEACHADEQAAEHRAARLLMAGQHLQLKLILSLLQAAAAAVLWDRLPFRSGSVTVFMHTMGTLGVPYSSSSARFQESQNGSVAGGNDKPKGSSYLPACPIHVELLF
jgi:hypothetical protein